jgi:hypothetical protein
MLHSLLLKKLTIPAFDDDLHHVILGCGCHTPVLKEANRSFHTCAQDLQITRMTNSKVNNSQCYDDIIIRVYLLQNDPCV